MNFNFLNPAALWALPLAAVPVLFHLFLKRPPKIVSFGDLRLLKIVYEKLRPRRRVKEWLILMLRVMALLGLGLFFSRPVLHWGAGVGAGDSAAVVVLLDASYSMGRQEAGVSNWDRASNLARATLKSLGKADRSALIVFSDEVHFFSGRLSDQHEALANQTREFNPMHRPTRLLPALQTAYALLANSGASNKAVVILSDMASHGWTDRRGGDAFVAEWKGAIKDFDPNVRALWPELPMASDNVSVENVQVLPDLHAGVLRVQAEVRNWGGDSVTGLPVTLDETPFLNSNRAVPQRRSEVSVNLAPRESKTVTLSAPLTEKSLAGQVSVRADALAADDAFYFARPAPRRVRVLCVEDRAGIAVLTGESYYLRQALLAPPSPFEVTTVTLSELKRMFLKDYDVLALINPSEPDPQTVEITGRFKRSGGALLWTLGERSFAHRLAAWSDLLPCSLLEIRDMSALTLSPVEVEDNDPAMTIQSGFEWEKVRVFKAVQPVLREDASALVRFSDGTPLLALSADSKAALWTTSVNRDWTNIPSKPLFVTLARAAIMKLSGMTGSETGAGLRAGESLRRRLPAAGEAFRADLRTPSGESVEIKALQREAVSAPLEEPGLYALRLGGASRESLDQVEPVPVNAARRENEGDGTRVSAEELHKILPGTRFAKLPSGERYSIEFLAALRGKEMGRALLLWAGFCLLGEIALLSRRKA